MTDRAKTLSPVQFNQLLRLVADESRTPLRDYAVLCLSFKAGLRVAEIAGLDWADVTDPFGAIRQDALEVPADIAKKGRARTVPMHPALYATLLELKRVSLPEHTRPRCPVIRSGDNRNRIVPNTLQRYIGRLYERVGLDGCSSHSGRRSFLTEAARKASTYGCSLKDVQALAGHAYINTTEAYIDHSANVNKLVSAL